MKCVYLLKSLSTPDQRYIGVTRDLEKRLTEHNGGLSKHTAKYVPWECVVAIWFTDHRKADTFEAYLKQGSGRAFTSRHF